MPEHSTPADVSYQNYALALHEAGVQTFAVVYPSLAEWRQLSVTSMRRRAGGARPVINGQPRPGWIYVFCEWHVIRVTTSLMVGEFLGYLLAEDFKPAGGLGPGRWAGKRESLKPIQDLQA